MPAPVIGSSLIVFDSQEFISESSLLLFCSSSAIHRRNELTYIPGSDSTWPPGKPTIFIEKALMLPSSNERRRRSPFTAIILLKELCFVRTHQSRAACRGIVSIICKRAVTHGVRPPPRKKRLFFFLQVGGE